MSSVYVCAQRVHSSVRGGVVECVCVRVGEIARRVTVRAFLCVCVCEECV
jgi:hypothetical protein